MFLAEAQLASRIKHPNVCETFDLGEDRGVLYLVMEWIDGEPLTTLTHRCAARDLEIPREITAWILAKAARGLAAAHELGGSSDVKKSVVHRDVSPQNILVTATGQVKIVDFGVAKAAERSNHTTESGLIKGKLLYLAPEQIDRRDIDARVDTFALGTVLYEMTTGRHPFRGETDLATLLAVSSADPIEMPGEGYPPELREILEKALAKDREQRYPTMRALAGDLEAYAAANGATEDAVTAFLGDVLGEIRAERSTEIHTAIREADERNEREANEPVTSVATTTDAITRPVAPEASRTRPATTTILAIIAGIIAVGWLVSEVRVRNASRSETAKADPIPSAAASPIPLASASAPASSASTPTTTAPLAPPAASVAAAAPAIGTASGPSPAPIARAPRVAVQAPSAAMSREVPARASVTPEPRPPADAPREPASAPTVFHRPGF